MSEINSTDLDKIYSELYDKHCRTGRSKDIFTNTIKRKLHDFYTLKKVNSTEKPLTKFLEINLKGRVIVFVNKQQP